MVKKGLLSWVTMLVLILIKFPFFVQAEPSEFQPDHDIADDMDDIAEQVEFF